MKNKLTFIIAILVTIFISSCSKDDNNITKEKYLEFSSIEEYNKTLSQIMSMSEEERIEWENQQGFTSFATLANEEYTTVTSKELTISELKSEVAKSNYLVLQKDGETDLILEAKLETTSLQYIINNNRIFKIGNNFYKVFEDNIVVCNEDYVNILISLTENNYNNCLNKNFKLMYNETNLKDSDFQVTLDGIETITKGYRFLVERRNDNKKNSTWYRTRIRAGFDIVLETITTNVKYSQSGTVWVEARGYMKRLGIWYRITRTTTYDFNVLVGHFTTNGWESLPYSTNGSTMTNEVKPDFNTYTVYTMGSQPTFGSFFNYYHFDALECKARIPETDYAQLNFNTQLF